MTIGDTKLSLDRIRIATDEFEDLLIAKLVELHTTIRSGDIAKSDEQITDLIVHLETPELEDEDERSDN